MIKLYDSGTNSSIDMMIGNIMENIFFSLVIFLTIWIFASLLIWLIRKLYKIRENNKMWYQKSYN